MNVLSKTFIPLVIGLAVIAAPVSARGGHGHGHGDHEHGYEHGYEHGHDHNDHDHDNGHHYGDKNHSDRDHEEFGHAYGHHKDHWDAANHDNRWRDGNHYNNYSKKHFRNWNDERLSYRNNWNRLTPAQQANLNSQMQAQWLAYHHNQWNGANNWNNYNDPQFLDYLHQSNPGILTTLRGYLGF